MNIWIRLKPADNKQKNNWIGLFAVALHVSSQSGPSYVSLQAKSHIVSLYSQCTNALSSCRAPGSFGVRHSIETVQILPAFKLKKLTPKQVLKGMLTECVLVAAPAVKHAKHSALIAATEKQAHSTVPQNVGASEFDRV